MGNKKNKKKKLTKWSKRNLHRIIAQRIKEQANSTKENADENNISTTELPDESLLFGESCPAKDTNETNQAPLVELHTVSPTLRESTRNNIERCPTPLVELRTVSPGFFEREYSPTIEKIETSQASQLDVRTISSSPRPRESIITVTENVERCQTPLTELRTTLGGFLECETSPIENIDTNQAPLIELQRVSPSLRESDLFITEDNSTEGCRMPLMDIRATSSSPDETQATFIIEKENEEVSIETNVGRRLIDIQYFFKELQEISAHASLFKCDLSTIKLTGEKRIGLQSEFKFKCELCGKDFKISSDNPKHTDHVNVNIAACSGIVAAGIGYSQFEEICSAMDVPVFTERYFAKVQDQVFNEWEASAVEAMQKAAKREYDAAIAEGRVKDGIPVIDVYIDGAWSARSYGNNYRALSGVAAIVGRRFGEVLFIGVKNKYCLICARAEKKEETPKDHVCYKNYEGSSSSMEAAIICEGFKQSLEMYGLIYGNVIGDGDSSTYAKIIGSNPYPNHVVSKIECRNHLLRNMCNKLRAITKTTKYPLEHRKLMTDKKIMSARKVITTAIKEKREHVGERDEAIKVFGYLVFGYLGIWGGEDQKMEVLYIQRDDTFWKNCMEQKLVNFYMMHMIPELVDSRYDRGMPLRNTSEDNSCQ